MRGLGCDNIGRSNDLLGGCDVDDLYVSKKAEGCTVRSMELVTGLDLELTVENDSIECEWTGTHLLKEKSRKNVVLVVIALMTSKDDVGSNVGGSPAPVRHTTKHAGLLTRIDDKVGIFPDALGSDLGVGNREVRFQVNSVEGGHDSVFDGIYAWLIKGGAFDVGDLDTNLLSADESSVGSTWSNKC
jgi:hypothetical protein